MLATIDIVTHEDLEDIGPVQAYLELEQQSDTKPSLNLLYAMKLALEDRPWSSLTRAERVNLIVEIESWHEYQAQNADEIEQ